MKYAGYLTEFYRDPDRGTTRLGTREAVYGGGPSAIVGKLAERGWSESDAGRLDADGILTVYLTHNRYPRLRGTVQIVRVG